MSIKIVLNHEVKEEDLILKSLANVLEKVPIGLLSSKQILTIKMNLNVSLGYVSVIFHCLDRLMPHTPSVIYLRTVNEPIWVELNLTSLSSIVEKIGEEFPSFER